MEYDVEREQGQYHIRERGQVSRGTTVTDGWLEQMGFGRLSRLNIEAVVQAVTMSAFGAVLDRHAASRMPADIDFKTSSVSYPT